MLIKRVTEVWIKKIKASCGPTEPLKGVFDIETMHSEAKIWRTGANQLIRHGQLQRPMWRHTRIICVTFTFLHEPDKAYCISWEPGEDDDRRVIEEFDKVIDMCDHMIGKNSDRFDVKHINFRRAVHGLPGIPDWKIYTDDLERLCRNQFNANSMSLDFFSDTFGLGGKLKMVEEDWYQIERFFELDVMTRNMKLSLPQQKVYCKHHFGNITPTQVRREGKKALHKMGPNYGCKDVLDTGRLFLKLQEHILPKFNMSIFKEKPGSCKECGSTRIHLKDYKYHGLTKYARYRCGDCNKYAGRCPAKQKKKQLR